MELTFKQFFDFDCVYFPESFDWAKKIALSLPKFDLELPTMQKTAKIHDIAYTKNPILIQLSDGSKLFMNVDQFRRIEGKPEIGKTIIISMQRLSNDYTNLPSKITKCKII